MSIILYQKDISQAQDNRDFHNPMHTKLTPTALAACSLLVLLFMLLILH